MNSAYLCMCPEGLDPRAAVALTERARGPVGTLWVAL